MVKLRSGGGSFMEEGHTHMAMCQNNTVEN